MIIEKIQKIVYNLIEDKDLEFDISSNLKEDLGLGSFQIIQLISSIQSEFGFTLEVSDYVDENFVTIESVQNLISNKIELA